MVFNTRTENSKDDWETPQYFYDLLDKEFGFTLDPCASHKNHKCDKYFTIKDNGLKQSWKGEIVFCNPPYNKLSDWCYKCWAEAYSPNNLKGVVVLLIPNRTDTSYWHKFCMESTEIQLIKGRISFEINGKSQGSPNFGSVLVIFDCKKLDGDKYPKLSSFYHKENDLIRFKNKKIKEWL